MKVETTHLLPTQVTQDILCDSCGESCATEYGFEYMKLKADWGFASMHDCQTWTAQICEKCVVDKLGFVNFRKDNA